MMEGGGGREEVGVQECWGCSFRVVESWWSAVALLEIDLFVLWFVVWEWRL